MIGIGRIVGNDSITLRAKRRLKEELPFHVLSLRDQWQVKEPDRHRYPKWLRTRVAAAVKRGAIPKSPIRLMSGWESLVHIQHCFGGDWLDHPGRLVLDDGTEVYCSEPYHFEKRAREQLDNACRVLGLTYEVSDRSWWFPDNTLRITIRERPVNDRD